LFGSTLLGCGRPQPAAPKDLDWTDDSLAEVASGGRFQRVAVVGRLELPDSVTQRRSDVEIRLREPSGGARWMNVALPVSDAGADAGFVHMGTLPDRYRTEDLVVFGDGEGTFHHGSLVRIVAEYGPGSQIVGSGEETESVGDLDDVSSIEAASP
jgi:hypothetical protein